MANPQKRDEHQAQPKQKEKKPDEDKGHARTPHTEPPKDKRSDDL